MEAKFLQGGLFFTGKKEGCQSKGDLGNSTETPPPSFHTLVNVIGRSHQPLSQHCRELIFKLFNVTLFIIIYWSRDSRELKPSVCQEDQRGSPENNSKTAQNVIGKTKGPRKGLATVFFQLLQRITNGQELIVEPLHLKLAKI